MITMAMLVKHYISGSIMSFFSILSLVFMSKTEGLNKQFVMVKLVISWKDNTKNFFFPKKQETLLPK